MGSGILLIGGSFWLYEITAEQSRRKVRAEDLWRCRSSLASGSLTGSERVADAAGRSGSDAPLLIALRQNAWWNHKEVIKMRISAWIISASYCSNNFDIVLHVRIVTLLEKMAQIKYLAHIYMCSKNFQGSKALLPCTFIPFDVINIVLFACSEW